MKFKNIKTGAIIETKDKMAIERFKGYPDVFKIVEETKKIEISKEKNKIEKSEK